MKLKPFEVLLARPSLLPLSLSLSLDLSCLPVPLVEFNQLSVVSVPGDCCVDTSNTGPRPGQGPSTMRRKDLQRSLLKKKAVEAINLILASFRNHLSGEI